MKIAVLLSRCLPNPRSPFLPSTNLPRRAVSQLHRAVYPGSALLAINGRHLDLGDNSPSLLELLEVVGQEQQASAAVLAASEGLDAAVARAALSLRSTGAASGHAGPRLRLGASRGVVFLNDLENDPRLRSMPRSLDGLLQPAYPGRLPYLRRNVFSAVIFLSPASLPEVGPALELILRQAWPLRLGLVFVDGPGAEGAALLAGAAKALGPDGAAACLADVVAQSGSRKFPSASELGALVRRRWASWQAQARSMGAGGAPGSYDSDSDEDEEAAQGGSFPGLAWSAEQAVDALVPATPEAAAAALKPGAALAASTGVAAMVRSAQPLLVLNGQLIPVEDLAALPMTVGQLAARGVREVQQDLLARRLVDQGEPAEELTDAILELRGGAVPRINPRIFPTGPSGSGKAQAAVPMAPTRGQAGPKQLGLAGPRLGPEARRAAGIRYWGAQERDPGAPLKPIVHWLVLDLVQRQSLELLAAALEHFDLRPGGAHIAVLVNRATLERPLGPLELALWAATVEGSSSPPVTELSDALESLLALPETTDVGSLTLEELKSQHGVKWAVPSSDEACAASVSAHERFVRYGFAWESQCVLFWESVRMDRSLNGLPPVHPLQARSAAGSRHAGRGHQRPRPCPERRARRARCSAHCLCRRRFRAAGDVRAAVPVCIAGAPDSS